MRRLSLIGLLALFSSGASARWQETLSPHFQVYHENAFLPAGLMMGLGRLHSRLRLDLSAFAPWMAKERVKVYLYAGQKAYVNGEFNPPAWSNGVAFYETKLIATYEMSKPEKLTAVLAHELTHLFFESYWGEAKKTPPVWLNEGLSMLEESSDEAQRKSEWYQAMQLLPGRSIPVQRFFSITPTRDMAAESRERVTMWYVQAYSLVYFLYRKHSRLQFMNFCRQLRDGKGLEETLWQVYRFKSPRDFERAWLDWLDTPGVKSGFRASASASADTEAEDPGAATRARGGRSPAGGKPGGKRLRTIGFERLEFHGLMPDK